MRFLIPMLLACTGLIAEEVSLWTEDLAAAKLTAKAGGKDLLLDFTGSDWCSWCIRLKREVFSTPEFIAKAPASFVLVELDFPRRTAQDPAIKAQNEKLQSEFQVEIFPTIWLADAAGRPYAKTGYRPGGPEAYLAQLDELKTQKTARDTAFAAAASLSGAAQAKALDRALKAMGEDVPLAAYQPEIDRIIALDADGAAGLKGPYVMMRTKSAIMAHLQAGEVSQAQAKLAAMLADPATTPAVRQELLMMDAGIRFQKDDKHGALVGLRAAVAADPTGEQVPMLNQVIARLVQELANAATASITAP